MNFITSLLFGKVAAGLLWILVPLCGYLYVHNTTLEFQLNRCHNNTVSLQSQLKAKDAQLDESRRTTEETIDQMNALEAQYASIVKYYESLPKKQNTRAPVDDNDLDVIRGVRGKNGPGETPSSESKSGDTGAPKTGAH